MKIAQGKRPYGSPAFYDVFLGEKQVLRLLTFNDDN